MFVVVIDRLLNIENYCLQFDAVLSYAPEKASQWAGYICVSCVFLEIGVHLKLAFEMKVLFLSEILKPYIFL